MVAWPLLFFGPLLLGFSLFEEDVALQLMEHEGYTSIAQLQLQDGRRVVGRSVELQDDVYVLQLGSGLIATYPVRQVAQVDLGISSRRRAPSGILDGDARTLPGAGQDETTDPPSTREQVERLGPAARFRAGVTDPSWVPDSDWRENPANNQFRPTRWVRAPLDPGWSPDAAYTEAGDVTFFNPARFRPSILDPRWRPEDGFERRDRFWKDRLERANPPAPPPEPAAAGAKGEAAGTPATPPDRDGGGSSR